MRTNISKTQPTQIKTKIVWKGFVIRTLALLTLAMISYTGYFGYRIYRLQNQIIKLAPVKQENSEDTTRGIIAVAKSIIKQKRLPLYGEKNGRINILLLGMSGEGHKGKYLTDTIMLISINPRTYQSSMLSIPRDLYVKIPESDGIHTKINAIYAFETKNNNDTGKSFANIKKVVKNITGQDVHYYLALNFKGFNKIIKQLGGIDIEVEHDIYDSHFPGPNYSYETFQISQGFHHLDADTALKYARVRHTNGGDFGRAKRQQQVIASAKRKAFSLKTITNPIKITSIMNILGDNFKTDIQLGEIPSFIHFVKNINIYQTTTKVLDAWSTDSLLGSTHVEMGGVQSYILIPRAKNFSQVHELAENIFNLDKIKKRKNLIKNERAKIVAITKESKNNKRIKKTFKKLGYNKINIERSIENFRCNSQNNSLLSFSKQPKLFTLDDLTAKLEMEVEYRSRQNENYDIAVCLSEDTLRYFEKQYTDQKEIDKKIMEQTIITENGNILYSKEY